MSASATSIAASVSSALSAPLLCLHDAAFTPDQPGAYNIYLSVGPQRLRLAVIDAERRKFVALEDYAVPAAALPALAVSHEYLGRRGWNEVRVAVAGRAFTLLPQPLFRPGDETAALRLHHELTPAEAVSFYPHPGLDLVDIFAVEAALLHWLTAAHGSAGRLLHHTSALLAGLAHQRGPAAPRRLYLNLSDHELTIAVLGQHLEYCNVFAFATAEDVVYYTILVMQELGLNPDQEEVSVWGELTHDSAIFGLLRTYLRHVRLGQRPADVQYSYRLNDVFDYRYFDVFSLHFV